MEHCNSSTTAPPLLGITLVLKGEVQKEGNMCQVHLQGSTHNSAYAHLFVDDSLN